MNIDMINNQNINHMLDVEKSQNSSHSSVSSRMSAQGMGYSLDIRGKVMENAAYGKEELKSAKDIALEASMSNVTLERNYKAVMSNSMSDEDFAKLCEDGVNPVNTTVNESVTNLDKIKLTMAEAGVTIDGYNDDLSREDIEAVVGSTVVGAGIANSVISQEGALPADDAKAISDVLSVENLPETKETKEKMMEALSTAMTLEPLSKEAMKYMINNDLEPSIENVYKAEHSAGEEKVLSPYGIKVGAQPVSENASAWEELKPQAEQVIVEAGLSDNSEALEDAKWIIDNNLPLTKETLLKYEELKGVTLPVNKEDVIKSMAYAVEEGLEPKEAKLNQTESLYEKAVRLVDSFANLSDGGDITKRRQLEEVRLFMTAEANLTLLRKGIQIETQPLEELVEKLKEAEREFYAPVLENSDDLELLAKKDPVAIEKLDEKIDLYKATRRAVDILPEIPVRTVAELMADSSEGNDFSLGNVAEQGQISIANFQKANESYEALMTAPRADMGDSIKKAFANVDDILSDLGIDINEANRKAVRTLGYAGMPITEESIDTIREATMTVQRVAKLMTPEKTLSMIREGHNPLNESMYDLEKELSEESFEEAGEKYAEFLWKLEKKGQITEDEKSAYIGMYRLLHQIEKQDGRVIGNVLSNGQELTMANMLAASRSNKHKNMDVKIDDDFGMLEEVIAKGESITEQIERGFTELVFEAYPVDYAKERMDEVRKTVKSADEAEKILEKIDEPVTIENIIAASDMLSSGGRAVKRLFNQENNQSDRDGNTSEGASDKNLDSNLVMTDEDADSLLSDFTDRDSAEAAYEKYIEKALQIAEQRTENADIYIDVRQWAMVHRQLGLASSMSKKEAYDIPIRTENGYTAVHLTIEHGGETSGKVTASLQIESFGKVEAKFSLKGNEVDGFVVSDSRFGLDALKEKEEAFKEAFENEGMTTKNLSFVYSRNASANDFVTDEDAKATNNQLYRLAKAFVLVAQEM